MFLLAIRTKQGDADKVLEAIAAWSEAVRGGGDADPVALGALVQELLQKEESFAEQNAKRLRLVAEAFLRDDFETIVNIVDCLMQPLDALMN